MEQSVALLNFQGMYMLMTKCKVQNRNESMSEQGGYQGSLEGEC